MDNKDGDLKKSKQNVNKQIKATDYSAWEKFDVEKECSKIDKDSDSDSELTDENDETMRDEAVFQKEKVLFILIQAIFLFYLNIFRETSL